MELLESRVLLAADPISGDHPLWTIPRGTAVIDGVLNDADWDSAYSIFRTQATRNDRAATIRMMYNDAGIFLSVDVEDENLWADGNGGGAGSRWEVETDDSITFYFDPDLSRDEYFADADRAFGVNIGNFSDDKNGSGTVRRFKFVKGDGAGGGADADWYGDNWFDIEQRGEDPEDYYLPPGASYVTVHEGTVNNAADLDTGWSTEIFLPWSALGLATPTHGQTMGMNFDLIQDNDGGIRNLNDNRDGPDRFNLPHFVDDHIQGVHSAYDATQAGIHGPLNYAVVMFIDSRAGARPAAITDFTAVDVSAFGGEFGFTAPTGTEAGLGHVSGYEIRASLSPMTSDAEWWGADEMPIAYVPRLAGLSERVRLIGLNPDTTYHVAVRAIDAAGNYGALSNTFSFTTSALGDASYRGRIVVSPMGNTLVFENGDAFVPVGDHLGLSWNFTRNLYPGDVWDHINGVYHNFHDEPSFEGPAGPYFDTLQAHGINTMRVYLELQNVHMTDNPEPPRGLYWLEHGLGDYNPDMRQFILNILEEAAAHEMYLIFSPFDTFSYDEAFGTEGPWATNFGGPLTDIDDFFQTPETLEISRIRMKTLIDWVAESPYADHLLGWEPPSEWESYEWTLNAEGDADPGREREMRTRAIWMDALAEYIQEEDPDHLVFNSTIVRDPRGPLSRLIFHSRNFDALSPHLYSNSNEEPHNNPDEDKSVRAAIENGFFTSYWLTSRIDRRPILNGEWGMTRTDWPGGVPRYSEAFTEDEDNALFRTMIWSGLASGQIGTGLRIAADELDGNGYILTDVMRDLQLVFSRFVNSSSLGIDFASFNYENLAGRIRAEAVNATLHAWGISDGRQGIAYVLKDGNTNPGSVSGGTLIITGLRKDQLVDLEIWSTAAGVTGPLSTISGVFVSDGTLTISLPTISTDLAIKFKAREGSFQSQRLVSVDVGGQLVTFSLGIDGQPIAFILNAATGAASQQDVAGAANFRGRAVDMTPFTTSDGTVHLALTDDRHHAWLLSGQIASGVWSAVDLTALIGAAGMTGDLTTYQPSWGAIHVAGLDARGHAINYWWAPGLTTWQYSDLTALFNGPTLARGLAGYVTGWDGLNLAGLNDNDEVIVYWWAPGLTNWETLNMTAYVEGPQLFGQLDAYVTPWGGLNIAGLDSSGSVIVYWWAPGLERWQQVNLTQFAAAETITQGVEVGVSADGGINIFGLSSTGDLRMLRWTPVSQNWVASDVRAESSGPAVDMPLSSAASGNRLVAGARRSGGNGTLVLFSFFVDSGSWQALDAPIVPTL